MEVIPTPTGLLTLWVFDHCGSNQSLEIGWIPCQYHVRAGFYGRHRVPVVIDAGANHIRTCLLQSIKPFRLPKNPQS